MPARAIITATLATLVLVVSAATAEEARSPHPATNPDSPVMLSGAWLPEDSHQLDFKKLPRVLGEHVVVSDVRDKADKMNPAKGGVNQHNYLAFHDGRFWAMWSDGPSIEDKAGQVVKYATSTDGSEWSKPQLLTPYPPGSGPDSPHYNTRAPEGMRWIARGFWQRDGELLALASLDETAGFFGPGLELRAFRFNKTRAAWDDAGGIYKDAINNFPPKKLPSGDWLMSRRPHNYRKTGVHILIGGVEGIDRWESYPIFGTASKLSAEEPGWWILPDNNLCAIFRDNRRSRFIYRSFSTDSGRTWSKPVKTNFPDATSKMRGIRLSDGRYVLVSNANPRTRNPLTLAVSPDGLVFNKLMVLVDAPKLGYNWIDYPDVMEHGGCLYIAFAGNKGSVNVLKVTLADMDAVKMPGAPLALPYPITFLDRKVKYAHTTRLADTFDLGDEGGNLFITARMKNPAPGQACGLDLTTEQGAQRIRVRVGVNKHGRYWTWLFRHAVTGRKCEPGETVTLAVKVVSHAKDNDEVLVNVYPSGEALPADEPEKWSIVNRGGWSNADLATANVTTDLITNVVCGSTWRDVCRRSENE